MSIDISVSSQMLEAKFLRFERQVKEIANIFINNPQALDGNQRKNEIMELLQWQLYHKLTRNESEKANHRKTPAIRLAVLVKCYKEENSILNALRIFEFLFNASDMELKDIPMDLKQEAYEICSNIFEMH